MSIDVRDIEEKRKQLCSIIMAVNDALGRFKAIAGQNDTETEQIQKHSRFLEYFYQCNAWGKSAA